MSDGYLFDLHLHTSRHSPDSVMHPDALLKRAQEIGLTGFVITEHDWLWTEAELDELRASAPKLVILSGIEVSTREGHFLAYGVTDPFAVPAGIGVRELCKEVHRQGGAVVAAHPFRFGQKFLEVLAKERPELDGLEMMSSNMDPGMRRQTRAVQEERNLAGLGNSDAHHEATLGWCVTKFLDPVRNNADLVNAIRNRRTVPVDRSKNR